MRQEREHRRCEGAQHRIYVDDVYFAFIGIQEQLESIKIVRIDEEMPWPPCAAALNPVHRNESGIDWIAKTPHHDKFFYRVFRRRSRFARSSSIACSQRAIPLCIVATRQRTLPV